MSGDLVEPRFKGPRTDNDWPTARAERLALDGHTCQAHRYGITTTCEPWPGIEAHHRLPRGRGGTNDLHNLVTLCSGHHRWVESNRADAYRVGLLLRRSTAAPVARVDLVDVEQFVAGFTQRVPLTDSQVRTLAVVLAEWHESGRCTVRAVAGRRGCSVSTVHRHLELLAELGLVGWESGVAGTLRPLVRRVA